MKKLTHNLTCLLLRSNSLNLKGICLLAAFSISAIAAFSQTVSEGMGTAPSTISIAAHEAANGFDLDYYTYSGTGDLRNTTPSPGGLANVFLTNSVGRDFRIAGINTSGCTSASLIFRIYKSGGAASPLSITDLVVEYSTDGANYTSLDWGGHTGGAVWILSSSVSIPSADGLIIRFRQAATVNQVRIDDVVISGSGPCASAILPIELRAFDAQVKTSSTLLSFSTATEHNNDYFAVERSTDGLRFEAIGKVTGAGNSTVPQHYIFTDERPVKGLNFYRLKQVDFAGQFSYSPVVSVTFGRIGGLFLAPQPAVDQLRVSLEQAAAQDGQWQVYDFAGRLVQSGTLEAEATGFEVPTATFTEGNYVLRVVSGQTILTQQFQKR